MHFGVPMKGICGCARRGSHNIGVNQDDVQRHISRCAGYQRQTPQAAASQLLRQHVFRQPGIGKTRQNGRERASMLLTVKRCSAPEPSLVARMRGAGVAHHGLNMARQDHPW